MYFTGCNNSTVEACVCKEDSRCCSDTWDRFVLLCLQPPLARHDTTRRRAALTHRSLVGDQSVRVQGHQDVPGQLRAAVHQPLQSGLHLPRCAHPPRVSHHHYCGGPAVSWLWLTPRPIGSWSTQAAVTRRSGNACAGSSANAARWVRIAACGANGA
jgi:hypothetical protein